MEETLRVEHNCSSELQTGQMLKADTYRIVSVLGRGGFGITYAAEHIDMRRMVCIKEFFPRNYYSREGNQRKVSLIAPSFAETIDAYKQKFLKEARTLASIDHPNIVRVHDAFAENGTVYYVMDYIEGASLDVIVRQSGGLKEAMVRSYIEQTASALRYMHSRNLLHLDIKPQNIMVSKHDGRIILIDFGLTKHYGTEDGKETTSTAGGYSNGYAPIEQYNNRSIANFTPQTDIYSLGATLYYTITAKCPPHPSDIDYTTFPVLPEGSSEILCRAIRAAMQYNSKDRPHSIDAFLDIMRIKRRGRRWWVAAASVVALMVVGGVGYGVLSTNMSKEDKVVANVSVEELIALGKSAYDAGDSAKAFDYWLRAANRGGIEAQIEVGSCYRHGKGVEQDGAKAIEWYERAAASGDVHAYNLLGECYFAGEIVDKDIATAIEWYTKAAEQGNMMAQSNLAMCYMSEGATQDFNEAMRWFEAAALQGSLLAQMQLGSMLFHGNVVERDIEAATRWYQMAAEQGDAEAEFNLAQCYTYTKDYTEALKWYTAAAEHGDAQAQCYTGICYEAGYGAKKNMQMAIYWYEKSASQGFGRAEYLLGLCYEYGNGVATNKAKAKELYRRAEEHGYNIPK